MDGKNETSPAVSSDQVSVGKGFSRLKRIFGVRSKGGYQPKKSKKEVKTKEKYSLEEDGKKPTLASTLARKISFKKVKSVEKFVQAKIASLRVSTPSTSFEELAADLPGESTPSFQEKVVTTEGGGESEVSQLEASGDLKPLDREPSPQSRAASEAPEVSAEVTSRIRAAWMSESVASMEAPQGEESTPGSSKSEGFFTPTDSPITSVDVAVESPKYTYKSPAMVNGEDLMTEARARLSQSLGVANATATYNQVGDKREHLYKILVIGELGTGKTSIIKRYVHQFFSQHYRATIGVDFALKVLNWDANTIIRLQLWDIAGQERFGNMTRVYYKEAVGAFIVFDVTRAATFDAVLKWKQDLDSKVQLPDGTPIPCVLLANKCDQQKEGIVNQPAKMNEYCKERGFSGWFETSAKENINIEEAARSLVTKILQNDQVRIQSDSVKDGEKFNLDGNNLHDEKAKGKCSC